ncbi:molecular chaperone HtpG [Pedomonas mirosovicensis]|uniref:molecular chaperone HtpG n=1 Tax=Pedomonas mirosovicensis TaxID=2908641 RepID=UPI002168DB34|nr:molecular chaperone HtpG [Pedomonas mirosovicensis]MCH8683791.1 molecular chaperone HtpG [Pedomonas mirosovicensis]
MADRDAVKSESFGFQAEVARLLHMMVHSVYSEREIFLRELISNAADACDRRRYEALTRPELLGDTPLEIVITIDKAAKTLTLSDTGIGMSREDLIENLGTIARSGTARFMEAVKGAETKSSAPDLIGQFGVGFYSAFMVADKVRVVSRRAGSDEAFAWESDGLGSFTVEPATRDATGTTITLHMKEDAAEFLEKYRLSSIIRTYSDHIAIPIKLTEGSEAADTVNTAKALWTRPKSEIEEKDYAEFYRHTSGLFDEPLRTLHFRAEGKLEYTCLLFTPSQAPFDLYDPERKSKVKLYVKRVFITDDCEELLPAYLRFMRGVVDAQDLALNISREMLQHNPVLAAMKKAITGKVLGDLAKMAENEPETYAKFWGQFGKVLKEGLYEDFDRRDDILKLTRFKSTGVEGWTSLGEYISRMKEGQKAIYYLTTEEGAASSPQLEGFKARGIEVLLLTDPIDDFWLGVVTEFDGKPLQSITKASSADLSALGEAKDLGEAAPETDVSRLIAVMKGVLGDSVKDIRASERLTDSPVCLVADEGDMDLRLSRMLKAHDRLNAIAPRVLEINPRHALVKQLAERSGQEGQYDTIALASQLLLDQARILEGEPLPDLPGFSKRMSDVLLRLAQ